jgi:hypothetical protein
MEVPSSGTAHGVQCHLLNSDWPDLQQTFHIQQRALLAQQMNNKCYYRVGETIMASSVIVFT